MIHKRSIETLLLLALTAFAGLGHASDTEANKDLARRFVAATNELDFAALEDVVSPDMIRHSQSTPGLVITNLDDFKAYLERDAATFQGARVDVDTMVAEGDRVALYGKFSGKHVGNIGPIEATGISVSLDVHAMFRIENGRIAECWILWDNAALLTQLGHMPSGPSNENQDE